MDKQEWVRRSALGAALGFGALAVFQLLLAAGAPLGDAAWGGSEARLSRGLRVGSAFSVLFYVVAAAVILRRAGLDVRGVSDKFARRGAWVLVVILSLSAVGNLISPSPWERFLLGPTGLVLATLCFTVARGRASDDPLGADQGGAVGRVTE